MTYLLNNGEELPVSAITDAYHTEGAYLFWHNGEAEQIDCLSIWLRGRYNSPYTVLSGVNALLQQLQRWRFTPAQLAKIAKRKLPDGTPMYPPEFIAWLGAQRPWCKIYAARDGDILFPGPVMNIIGPRWFVKRLGTLVANTLRNLSSPITKAVRVRDAAGPLLVWQNGAAVANPGPKATILGGELRRTNDLVGLETSLNTLIAGFNGTSNEAVELAADIQPGGSVDHYYMMSGRYPTAGGSRTMLLQRMQQYAAIRPNFGTLLPDTKGNIYQNLDDAVQVLVALRAKGQGKGYRIRLDSGNLAQLYHYLRRKLDEAGLHDVQIFLSGGINAMTIRKLTAQGVPLENLVLMVGEYLKHRMELGNHGNAGEAEANVEFIDKLSAIQQPNADGSPRWVGRMKLADGKLAYPGVLERLRLLDEAGQFMGDVTVDSTTFTIPHDGVLADPLTSIWRYTKLDGTPVKKDTTFPAGTRFMRVLQPVWDNQGKSFADGVIDPAFWQLDALKTYTATNLARLPPGFRGVEVNGYDTYGVGVEESLYQRAMALMDADEISTEYFDLAC